MLASGCIRPLLVGRFRQDLELGGGAVDVGPLQLDDLAQTIHGLLFQFFAFLGEIGMRGCAKRQGQGPGLLIGKRTVVLDHHAVGNLGTGA